MSLCGFPFCGAGTVHYSAEHRLGDSALRLGIAYLVPDPPPRLHASTHFALAYDTGSPLKGEVNRSLQHLSRSKRRAF
jgi:hypothetical protein